MLITCRFCFFHLRYYLPLVADLRFRFICVVCVPLELLRQPRSCYLIVVHVALHCRLSCIHCRSSYLTLSFKLPYIVVQVTLHCRSSYITLSFKLHRLSFKLPYIVVQVALHCRPPCLSCRQLATYPPPFLTSCYCLFESDRRFDSSTFFSD